MNPAAKLVEEYLRVLMIPDPEAARRYCAPDMDIRFTSNRPMRDPSVRRLQPRTLQVGEEGTLYCEWPDGTKFEGNRYVDRYIVRGGKIARMEVWNDSAEWLLVRAGLAKP